MSRQRELLPNPRSRFLKVKCLNCGEEQVVFDRAAMVVRCHKCKGVLAQPGGGRAKILKGEVLGRLE